MRIAAWVALSMIGSAFATEKSRLLEFRVIFPAAVTFPFGRSPAVPAYLAIHSSEEWITFWSASGRLSPPSPRVGQPADPDAHVPLLDVDFEHFTLLAVEGPKPTGGYSLSISSIRRQATGILVTVLDVSPGGVGCATTQVITYPAVFALIPKTDEPVNFQVEHAKADCNIRPTMIESETR